MREREREREREMKVIHFFPGSSLLEEALPPFECLV